MIYNDCTCKDKVSCPFKICLMCCVTRKEEACFSLNRYVSDFIISLILKITHFCMIVLFQRELSSKKNNTAASTA